MLGSHCTWRYSTAIARHRSQHEAITMIEIAQPQRSFDALL